MCWLLIGGLTLGLETQGCLGRSSNGALFHKVCLQRETKKGRNGRLSPMGLFILALDSFYGLTGNFIICFEAISYSVSVHCGNQCVVK
jgi:hypothetical protein